MAGCDCAELRADGFARDSIPREARAFRRECLQRLGRPLETLLTLRLERDGGAWPDVQAGLRGPVWESLGLDGSDPACDWVDVEVEEMGALPARAKALLSSGAAKLLLSHHDMRKSLSGEGLRNLLRDMQAYRPAGMKFAVTCGSRDELLDLLAFAREVAAATANGCVLSMGRAGRASRVLAPLLGCPLTYGYLTGGAVAPGQLSASELGAFYRGLDDRDPRGPDRDGGRGGGDADSRLLDWAEARVSETLRRSVSGEGDLLAE
ncbi:MAG TPA: type I 3-dehydroquinate dehydratase [Fibrobacteria bacterium]|nr:type I 3-dehydroquinate dehydratase [Fibrobacteria bacterium]